MFIAAIFPDDGQPRQATLAGTYSFRQATAELCIEQVERFAKSAPERKFTAWVLDEETGRVVCWTRYTPKPVIDWIDPAAMELKRMMELGGGA